jgi:hypothetical protein
MTTVVYELTPEEEHQAEMVTLLLQRRQSLRAQLEHLEGIEARKAALQVKLDATNAELTARGWEPPVPLEVSSEPA